MEPGSFVADLRVEIPAGVKVVELDPSSVTFELDMVSSAQVEVVVECREIRAKIMRRAFPWYQ